MECEELTHDYASSSSKSPQSSSHYGSEITHASPTQRSAKEFVDPFSFGTKSRDHGYEDVKISWLLFYSTNTARPRCKNLLDSRVT